MSTAHVLPSDTQIVKTGLRSAAGTPQQMTLARRIGAVSRRCSLPHITLANYIQAWPSAPQSRADHPDASRQPAMCWTAPALLFASQAMFITPPLTATRLEIIDRNQSNNARPLSVNWG
ncbi:hypothetical protein HNQ59_002477 [Chitinivorax tropicus]|uniref:Uncharacterized protein n=1 Tax=Chitinivorax tropicus TaxID=714531 RepID=A0A840MQ15_9PROT|nr:hypothetical protein [Chitinivorax tropicus]